MHMPGKSELAHSFMSEGLIKGQISEVMVPKQGHIHVLNC